MRPTGWRLLAAVSALLAAGGMAATRPRYGGTLRVEMRERAGSLDPAEKPAGAATRIEALVFERLVRFDENGRLQAGLAISWQADAAQKRWEFRLRPGVKFHDGYPLTAAAVGGTLQRLLGPAATVATTADALVVTAERPMPGLAAALASPAAAVSARGPDGALVGTGPFRVTRFEPGRHATLAAFDEHWGGRPFVDTVEIEMGRPTREQLVDLQVGRADVVEMSPGEARAATERGAATWASAPVELLALVFGQGRGADDARLREALALAIDRASIQNVLLQRQGAVTGALLPQWLSGYAFLFPSGMDLGRARQLAAQAAPGDRTMTLGYEAGDAAARIIAERIAVNARDAGITLQVSAQAKADVRLARATFSTPDGAQALAELAVGLGLGEVRANGDAEHLYAAERALVEGYRVVPLFHLPQYYGASPRVKLWVTPGTGRTGELKLADIWMEGSRP